MTFTLTKGQARAVEVVKDFMTDPGPAFMVLSGFAGVGKTTCLREIADIYGPPTVVAPTGRAALRVTEATGLQASTVHRFLYKVTEDPKTGDPVWVRKSAHDVSNTIAENRLLVVDEASMVGRDMWHDIRNATYYAGVKVLLVGDPFQLPPVAGKEAPFSVFDLVKDTPYHAHLDEVVRQALDSPIVRICSMVRSGESTTLDALSMVDEVTPERLLEAYASMPASKALIVWRNATRHRLNRECRHYLQLPENVLVESEPLVVTFNNYDVDRFNGETAFLDSWIEIPGDLFPLRNRVKNLSAMATFGRAQVGSKDVVISPEEAFGNLGEMPHKTISGTGRSYARSRGWGKLPHLNVNLGYCTTCHRAQGNEMDYVIVVIESGMRYLDVQGRRWVYTAFSRAKKNLKVCYLA